MIIKILLGSLLVLTTANAIAGKVTYLHDDGFTMETIYITDSIEAFYGEDKRAMLIAELRRARDLYAKTHLQNYQDGRRMNNITSGKSEIVFRNGSNIDVGAKMGMTTNQVLTKTHWGKPSYTNTATDEHGKLEQWIYGEYVNLLIFDNNKLISIQRVIKDTH